METNEATEVREYRRNGNWAVYSVPAGETLDYGKHYVRTDWHS
jgi:hypothetical protein